MTTGGRDPSMPSVFERTAEDAFDYLVRDYGYEFVGGDSRRLRWRSPKVDITVQLDPRSAELDVLVRPRATTAAGVLRRLKGDGGTPLSLSDIAAWRHADNVLARLPAVAEDSAALVRTLPELARWVRELGDPLLRGAATDFAALDRDVAKRSAQATRRFTRS
jgi:hypothetical protein